MWHFWCHVWWHFNHFCVMFDHLWYDVVNDILTLWCDGMMVWCYDSDILWWHCAEIAKYVFIQGFIAYFVWMMFCWLIYFEPFCQVVMLWCCFFWWYCWCHFGDILSSDHCMLWSFVAAVCLMCSVLFFVVVIFLLFRLLISRQNASN